MKKKHYLCNVFDSKKYCFIILNFKEMKKLVLSLAVLFSVAMVSCGNAEKACEDSCCDSAVVTEEVVVEDSTVADSVVADSAAVVAE